MAISCIGLRLYWDSVGILLCFGTCAIRDSSPLALGLTIGAVMGAIRSKLMEV